MEVKLKIILKRCKKTFYIYSLEIISLLSVAF